jgi:hypothetical protein
MNSDALAELAKQQKITNELLGKQQQYQLNKDHGTQIKWELILFAVIFFLVSRYVVLKQEFRPVFDLFATENEAVGQCLTTNHATAWNIVLNTAYPSVAKFPFLVEEPLSQDQAQFLWDAIRGNFFPTVDQINDDPISGNLGLVPLSYLCGNILATWSQALDISPDEALGKIKQSPENTPWHWFFNKDSTLLSSADDGLRRFTTEGFWGMAKWVGTVSAPRDMYKYIFASDPPTTGCGTSTKIAGVSSSVATFSMAGSAFGTPGAVAGAFVGLGLGLFTPTPGCGGKSVCTIQ